MNRYTVYFPYDRLNELKEMELKEKWVWKPSGLNVQTIRVIFVCMEDARLVVKRFGLD